MNEAPVPSNRTGCSPALLVVGLLAVIAIVVAGILASMPPTSFVPPASQDEEAAERARVFENNFASELTRVREDDGPWGVRVNEADLNAWLWFRLPAWVAHAHGADAHGSEPFLQSTIEPGRVLFSTESMVVALAPSISEGQAVVHTTRGSAAGRLPIPGFAVGWGLQSIDFDALGSVVFGGGATNGQGESVLLPGTIELPDGRSVQLLEIQLEEGVAVLVFSTSTP